MADNPASKVAILMRKATPTRKKQGADTDNINYTCQICSRSFGSSKALRSHCSATKHQVRCSICDKGFVSNEALRQHAHIHIIDATVNISDAKDTPVITLQAVNEKAVGLENPTMSPSLSESVIIQGMCDNFSQLLVHTMKFAT